MSDVMLLGVLRMPYDMFMNGSELMKIQNHARCSEAADRIEADAKTIAQLRATIAKMQKDEA